MAASRHSSSISIGSDALKLLNDVLNKREPAECSKEKQKSHSKSLSPVSVIFGRNDTPAPRQQPRTNNVKVYYQFFSYFISGHPCIGPYGTVLLFTVACLQRFRTLTSIVRLVTQNNG